MTDKIPRTFSYLLLVRQCNLTCIVQFCLQNQEAFNSNNILYHYKLYHHNNKSTVYLYVLMKVFQQQKHKWQGVWLSRISQKLQINQYSSLASPHHLCTCPEARISPQMGHPYNS